MNGASSESLSEEAAGGPSGRSAAGPTGRSEGYGRHAVYLYTNRPAVADALTRELERLEPRPVVIGAAGGEVRSDDPAGQRRAGDETDGRPPALAIVDLADPPREDEAMPGGSRTGVRRLALVEGSLADRLLDALAEGFDDYLFFPINRAELRLAWKRHLGADVPTLSLEVDEECLCLVCPSDVAYLRPAVDRMVAACRRLLPLSDDAAFRLRVALGEAVANAILHGNREDPGRRVTIRAELEPDAVLVAVADEGRGFDPEDVPDPTAPRNIARSTGRGTHLLRTLMDDVRYNETGNEVQLRLGVSDSAPQDLAGRSGGPAQPLFESAPTVEEQISPLVAEYRQLTDLEARLTLHRGATSAVIHDSLAGRSEDLVRRSVELGGGAVLELVVPTEANHQAVEFLADWVGHFVRYDARNADLVAECLKRDRVVTELELARDLQRKLLPGVGGYADLAEVAARCEPAHSVGGDFYLLTRPKPGQLGVMLGDVSSHGISAALIMAQTMGAASIFARERESPSDVLFEIHGELLRQLESTEMYMTLFYAVLDPAAGYLRYSNAGHAYAYRIEEELGHRLEALDPPIGMTAREGYREARSEWRAGGDLLVLLTDGLAAAVAGGTPEGDPALGRLVAGARGEPARIVDALFAVAGKGEPPDDRTALAVRSIRSPSA